MMIQTAAWLLKICYKLRPDDANRCMAATVLSWKQAEIQSDTSGGNDKFLKPLFTAKTERSQNRPLESLHGIITL